MFEDISSAGAAHFTMFDFAGVWYELEATAIEVLSVLNKFFFSYKCCMGLTNFFVSSVHTVLPLLEVQHICRARRELDGHF